MARIPASVATDAQAIEFMRACIRIGDMLVLADEAPTPPLRSHALIDVSAALRKVGQYRFALEQIDRALSIQPGDVQAQREKRICLEQAVAGAAAKRALPRQVLLFSGHMVDAPDREDPRFPADMEPMAASKIAGALDALGAGPQDVSFSQAASGGDLLFIEACQQRGVRCEVLLPFPETEFIQRSLLPASDGEAWAARFHAIKGRLQDPLRIMPEELGPAPHGVDPFERCNLWLLYTALACGIDKVRFIALWNGGGGDGPGGTRHMHDEVKRRTGQVTWLDTRTWR